jgi:hypothetical protein
LIDDANSAIARELRRKNVKYACKQIEKIKYNTSNSVSLSIWKYAAEASFFDGVSNTLTRVYDFVKEMLV